MNQFGEECRVRRQAGVRVMRCMRRRLKGTFLRAFATFALTCGVTLALSVLVRTQAPVQTPVPTPDVDKLFARIYPVFAHDRCANCHGRVKSYPGLIRSVTGKTHPGGEVVEDTKNPTWVSCGSGSCHDATRQISDEWQFTAPDQMSWADKSEQVVCAIEAVQVLQKNASAGGAEPTRKGSYLHHLATDALIDQAWHGRAGGARDPDDHPSPQDDLPSPPLSKAEFLAAAADWVNAGAPCRSTVSIHQVETFAANYGFPFVGTDGKTTVSESARREVNILRNPDGTAIAEVESSGHSTMITTYHTTGKSGPCTVTMTVLGDWLKTAPASTAADLKIKVEKDRYEISFTAPFDAAKSGSPPAPQDLIKPNRNLFDDLAAGVDLNGDTTKSSGSSRMENDCGIPNINDTDDPIEATWPPWDFTIRCPKQFADADGEMRCDPLEPAKTGKITGVMTRTVIGNKDGADPQSWLNVSWAGTSRGDNGQPLPITVTTRWNVRLAPK